MPIYYESGSIKSMGAAQLKKKNGKLESAPKGGFPNYSTGGRKSLNSHKGSYTK